MNVQNQINNNCIVGDGNTVIIHPNGSVSVEPPKPSHAQDATPITPVSAPNRKRTRTPKPPVIVNATFIYKWTDRDSYRISRLYQCLRRGKYIAEDTTPDDFIRLFSGSEDDFRIKWTGTKSFLAQLFNSIIEKKYITVPEGVGKWQIIQSHFVDSNSRPFCDLNKEKPSKKANIIIEPLSELLNPVPVEE